MCNTNHDSDYTGLFKKYSDRDTLLNPNIPEEVLRKNTEAFYDLIDQGRSGGMYYDNGEILLNSSLPIDLIERGSTSPDSRVRFYIAGNPSTPLSVLVNLMVDFNSLVRGNAEDHPILKEAIHAAKLPAKVFALTTLNNLTDNEIEAYKDMPEEWLDTILNIPQGDTHYA